MRPGGCPQVRLPGPDAGGDMGKDLTSQARRSCSPTWLSWTAGPYVLSFGAAGCRSRLLASWSPPRSDSTGRASLRVRLRVEASRLPLRLGGNDGHDVRSDPAAVASSRRLRPP